VQRCATLKITDNSAVLASLRRAQSSMPTAREGREGVPRAGEPFQAGYLY
jgi:hypothetical protein